MGDKVYTQCECKGGEKTILHIETIARRKTHIGERSFFCPHGERKRIECYVIKENDLLGTNSVCVCVHMRKLMG
jgi:hypothetical protein